MNDTPIVKNKYRALLTEMLPYEIPLLLDNSKRLSKYIFYSSFSLLTFATKK